MKLKSSQNGEITLLLTDVGKSCPSHKFLTSQICLLTLFVKIKFYPELSNLQYATQGERWDGPEPFCEKTINVKPKWTSFLAWPHLLFKYIISFTPRCK